MAGLALVPEKRELFGTMSVEDNLLLGGWRAVRQLVRPWRDGMERVYTLFPRLKERRAQLAGTLSGGERQMLAVGPRADGTARAADARRTEPRPGAADRARHLRHHPAVARRPA